MSSVIQGDPALLGTRFNKLVATPCFARRYGESEAAKVSAHRPTGSMISNQQFTWTVKCWLLILSMLIVDHRHWPPSPQMDKNVDFNPPSGWTKCETGLDWHKCWLSMCPGLTSISSSKCQSARDQHRKMQTAKCQSHPTTIDKRTALAKWSRFSTLNSLIVWFLSFPYFFM